MKKAYTPVLGLYDTQKAIGFIKQTFQQELARRLNYSLPYVSKRFKDGTGVPFMEYLQNYRVTEGCRLLSGTNRTLEEITRMVGYQDVKFFSALVKR